MKCSLGISNFLEEIAAAAAKSRQSSLTLCDPIDSSPPGSPVPGILQARTLRWVAIFFSNACKWKVKGKSLSRVRLLASPWTAAHQAPLSMGFSRQEYWSGLPVPSSLSHFVVFLDFFGLIIEEGFLISPYYSLELCIQMGVSFLFSFVSHFSPPVQRHEPLSIVLQALCLSDLILWIYLSLSLYNLKEFDLGPIWMV